MNRLIVPALALALLASGISACSPVPTVAPGGMDGLSVLVDALRAAGADVEEVREIRQPFLSVPGKV
ncbi:MAG: hypothetical protein ACRDG5_11225, partial [Anaerolineales bacterium]